LHCAVWPAWSASLWMVLALYPSPHVLCRRSSPYATICAGVGKPPSVSRLEHSALFIASVRPHLQQCQTVPTVTKLAGVGLFGFIHITVHQAPALQQEGKALQAATPTCMQATAQNQTLHGTQYDKVLRKVYRCVHQNCCCGRSNNHVCLLLCMFNADDHSN
jgi:hypothetical protein